MLMKRFIRGLCYMVAGIGAVLHVSNGTIYRGDRVRRLLISLTLYGGVGMYTVVALTWPWSLVGGLITDAILLYAGFQAMRIWEERLLHLAMDETLLPCTENRWCKGMNGHLGDCIYVDKDDMV